MKWIILLIIGILMIPLVSAGLCENEIEIGTNCTIVTPPLQCSSNYTIYNLTDIVRTGNMTLLNGSIYWFNFNETAGEYIIELCDTSAISILVRDSNMLQLAMILGIAFVVIVLLFVSYTLSPEHILGKILLTTFAMFILFLIPSSLINGATATKDNFLNATILIMKIMVGYVFVYLNYWWWIKKVLTNIGFIKPKPTTLKRG